MYQAGFLTDRIYTDSPSHTIGLCNGIWNPLPDHSDLFAWDFHPIPSSELPFISCSALDTAIINHTLTV